MKYRKTGKILHVIVRVLVNSWLCILNIMLPRADQILPKLTLSHKRLNRPDIKGTPDTFVSTPEDRSRANCRNFVF